jgi:hypothetical protein
MGLNSVVSEHSQRNYAKALDEVFAQCEERRQPATECWDLAVSQVRNGPSPAQDYQFGSKKISVHGKHSCAALHLFTW